MTDVDVPNFDPIRDLTPQQKLDRIDRDLASEGLTRETASSEKVKSLTDLYELEATDLQDQYTLKREEGKILPRIQKVPQKSLMELIKGQEKQTTISQPTKSTAPPPPQAFGSSDELTEMFVSKLREEEARIRGQQDTGIFNEEEEDDTIPQQEEEESPENKKSIAQGILNFMNKEIKIPKEVVSTVTDAFDYILKDLPQGAEDPVKRRVEQLPKDITNIIEPIKKVISKAGPEALKAFEQDILGKTNPKQIIDAASAALTGSEGQAVSSEMERIKQESLVSKIDKAVKLSEPIMNKIKDLSVDTLQRVATVAEALGEDAFKTTKVFTSLTQGRFENLLRDLGVLENQLTLEKRKAGPRTTLADVSKTAELIQEGDIEEEKPFIERMQESLKTAKQRKAGPRPIG